MPNSKSPELISFEQLEIWKATTNIHPATTYLNVHDPIFPLFANLYDKTKATYALLPKRKNGENPFVHPLNIVTFLGKAGITDGITLCCGLIHDYIEETVDMYKDKEKIEENHAGIKNLDKFEQQVTKELLQDLEQFCKTHKIPSATAKAIIETTKLLTRHKRDFYYKSISTIFQCKDEQIKERAIQIKLADRTHNILCIEGFSEEARLFQCFKNLFILNNTKKYLREKNQEKIFTSSSLAPTEKLFKKCAKATYCAFLTIGHFVRNKGIAQITPMLQLAFKKYALEQGGLWAVTKVNDEEVHLMRLFQGVVRKWDARLHHEWENFENAKKREYEFIEKFFVKLNFTQDQIKAIADYKDAYSLKEVVAYLLYQPEYIVYKFLSSDLSEQGRIE